MAERSLAAQGGQDAHPQDHVPDPPVTSLGSGAVAAQPQRADGDEGQHPHIAGHLGKVVGTGVVARAALVGSEHEGRGDQGERPVREGATGEEGVRGGGPLRLGGEDGTGNPLGRAEGHTARCSYGHSDHRGQGRPTPIGAEPAGLDQTADGVDGDQDGAVDDGLGAAAQDGEAHRNGQQGHPAAPAGGGSWMVRQRRRPGRSAGGEGVNGHDHPGQPGGTADEIDVDDLGGHVPGQGERGGGKGGCGGPDRLTTEEEVGPDDGDVVGQGQVEPPGGEGGEDGHEPGGGVGGTGVEPAQKGRPAEQVGVPEGKHPLAEVAPDQYPHGQVLEEVVAVGKGPAEQLGQPEDKQRDEEKDNQARVGPDPPADAVGPAGERSGGGTGGFRHGPRRGRCPHTAERTGSGVAGAAVRSATSCRRAITAHAPMAANSSDRATIEV